MFDESFSFLSNTEPPTVNVDDYTSADISPFTSRCSSPRYFDTAQPRLSQPAPRRDSRFDVYYPPRHPSVTALTAQLEHHVITEDSQPGSPLSMAFPADSTSDQDEGFSDGPGTPSTNYSDYSADFDPAMWDLSMTNLSATSSPRPSLSLEAQALSSYTQRRKQRQALVRLQCLAKRAPDVAMLMEECHPSSLPLTSETLWNAGKSRSNSTVSLGTAGNCRVEKDRTSTLSSVRKAPRMRKRLTR